MIGIFIIPTGIEAELGGHAGDANPAVRLMGACVDTLITHPNAVNGSDVNEMPENALYVEGSILDRFLEGKTALRRVLQNRILVAVNPPVRADSINGVSSARVTAGVDARILELETPLRLRATIENGRAGGMVDGWENLVAQVRGMEFDALAIHTPIEVNREIALNYYKNGGVNPWGGVEAIASRLIADALDKPVAHAPLEASTDDPELFEMFLKEVDPRIAPEAISVCYLHCVLKGLNRAPRPSTTGLSVGDVDFLVSPWGCWGRPHEACQMAGIPVIWVKENKTTFPFVTIRGRPPIEVENYLEAAGLVMCWRAGVHVSSVRRPLAWTLVEKPR